MLQGLCGSGPRGSGTFVVEECQGAEDRRSEEKTSEKMLG